MGTLDRKFCLAILFILLIAILIPPDGISEARASMPDRDRDSGCPPAVGTLQCFDLGTAVFGGSTEEDRDQRRDELTESAATAGWAAIPDVVIVALEVGAFDADRKTEEWFGNHCDSYAPGSIVLVGKTARALDGFSGDRHVVMVSLAAADQYFGMLPDLVSGVLDGFASQCSVGRVVFLTKSEVQWVCGDLVLSRWEAWLDWVGVLDAQPFADLLREVLDTPGARAPRFDALFAGLSFCQ